MQKYNKAPLPFLGQKRNWLKVVNQINFNDMTVVDLFGGSGLLSHEIKRNSPNAHVIWNDFDNYLGRLNAISETEQLRKIILDACNGIEKGSRIGSELKIHISELIVKSNVSDFVTVSSWLLFSGNYCHDLESLLSKGWYFSVPKNELSSLGYLHGVERVCGDFRNILSQLNDENTVIIADPPYIMTNQSGYAANNDKRFKLADAIYLMKELGERKAILFSSTKSETDDLLDVLNINITERLAIVASPGAGSKYKDLFYRINF